MTIINDCHSRGTPKACLNGGNPEKVSGFAARIWIPFVRTPLRARQRDDNFLLFLAADFAPPHDVGVVLFQRFGKDMPAGAVGDKIDIVMLFGVQDRLN